MQELHPSPTFLSRCAPKLSSREIYSCGITLPPSQTNPKTFPLAEIRQIQSPANTCSKHMFYFS